MQKLDHFYVVKIDEFNLKRDESPFFLITFILILIIIFLYQI